MTTASKATKASKAVEIKAPKITTAWNSVCATSGKAEADIIKAVENLSAVMVLESGLSVRDIKSVIAKSGKVSAFVSVSHVEALPTWSKLRALHADFKALPLSKQLSTASASYSLLGAGKGEAHKSLEILTKEIATVRKAKNSKGATPKASTPKASKASNLDAIKAFTALVSSLDFSALSDAEAEALSMLQITLEDASIAQA